MARVIFTKSASNDQAAILSYLHAEAGLRTATKYRALFLRLYDLLADHPAIGARRPALGPHVRIGIVLPYIVIYEDSSTDDTVINLRIVHGRRDVTVSLLATPR